MIDRHANSYILKIHQMNSMKPKKEKGKDTVIISNI